MYDKIFFMNENASKLYTLGVHKFNLLFIYFLNALRHLYFKWSEVFINT